MIQQVNYNPKDIEKFLEVTKLPDERTEDTQILKKLLSVQSKISIIADIDPFDLEEIVYDLKFTQYLYKDRIIEEGDLSNEIYFLFSGECQVFHKNKKVGAITTGKTFGEQAAIFNTKRNATVICSSQKATILSFCIDNDATRFCAPALALLYKNLAFQINAKLESMNDNLLKK